MKNLISNDRFGLKSTVTLQVIPKASSEVFRKIMKDSQFLMLLAPSLSMVSHKFVPRHANSAAFDFNVGFDEMAMPSMR